MTTTYQAGQTDFCDFVGQMIADHIEDESTAMVIATFCRDHPDSQTSEDFAYWLDGLNPEEAAIRLADHHNDLRAWIAEGEMDAFRQYAAEEFGIDLDPSAGM